MWEWVNTWDGQGGIWLVFDTERNTEDQLIAQYSLIPTPLSFFGKKNRPEKKNRLLGDG